MLPFAGIIVGEGISGDWVCRDMAKSQGDSDFDGLWSRLCKNLPKFVADGTALHIDYKSASDETLFSHLGIGKAREALQFTTNSFHFAFLHSLGR